jgi:hypothetical protein
MKKGANQALQATAGKRLGWQVGYQRPAVPELDRWTKVRASFQSTGLLLIVLLMCVAGCRHQPAANVAQKLSSPWAGFGEPGPGMISVVVAGDVRHPGHYYLTSGANLESIYTAFGGWGGHGEFYVAPYRMRLTREVGGKRTERYYQIRRMTKQEREALELKDGDTLYYATVLF